MDWDKYFINMLPHIAAKSKDIHTKVGAIIVGHDNEIRSTGYNSLVRGIDDTKTERLERPDKYDWTEHAERNAIYNAARIGIPLKGCRIYIPFMPCVPCSRALVSVGLIEIIVNHSGYIKRDKYISSTDVDKYKTEKYEHAIAWVMFKEAHTKFTWYRENGTTISNKLGKC
jgi:dCMP deaminase